MRLAYRIDGLPTLEQCDRQPEAGFFALVRSVRERLVAKLATLGFACKCEHEARLAQLARAGNRDIEEYILGALCPKDMRELYPNCAHNEDWGRDPDPFGNEIRTLIGLNILEPVTWNQWLDAMRLKILAVDMQFSVASATAMFSKPIPLPMAGEALQEPNLQEERLVGAVLIGITDDVLLQLAA